VPFQNASTGFRNNSSNQLNKKILDTLAPALSLILYRQSQAFFCDGWDRRHVRVRSSRMLDLSTIPMTIASKATVTTRLGW
jgi:hypothetical protein